MIYYIILIVMMFITSFLICIATKMQATTLFVGKLIAEPEELSINPRGYQDALTPKLQERLNVLYPVLTILVFILGICIKWYVGIISTIIMLTVITTILSYFVPRRMATYLRLIEVHVANKMADYKKENDYARAEATEYVLNRLLEFHQNEIDETILAPSMKEAKEL